MQRIFVLLTSGLAWLTVLLIATPVIADCPDTTEAPSDQTDETTAEPIVYSDEIQISELLPNPSTEENNDEYVELYNAGESTVDLTGWILSDASTNDYTLSGSISSQHYIVVYRSDSGLALNNSGDSVELQQPDGNRTDYIEYAESADDDVAYALETDGEWYWTTTPTPYRVNTITPMDSDTAEADDSVEQSEADADDNAANNENTNGDGDASDDTTNDTSETHQLSSDIFISELLPDPAGSDATDEWIELANSGSTDVLLNDWELQVGDDHYSIPDTITIEAAGYSLFSVTVTGLSLNNSGEDVALIDPTGAIMDSLTYPSAETGSSYAWVDDDWHWTATLTAGSANIFTDDSTTDTTTTSTEASSEHIDQSDTTSDNGTTNPLQTIAEINKLDSGVDVYTQGIVSVVPEIFSGNYFYIQDDTAGIQVYSSDKVFPELVVGDVVTVVGSRGTSNGEAKINISAAEDVVVTAQNQAIVPAGDITDVALNAGRVVAANGVITSKSGSTITLDTGVALYIKRGTGISTASFIEGETVSVTGVLVVTEDDTQIWPRSTADLVFGEAVAADDGTITAAGSTDMNSESAQKNSSNAGQQTITEINPADQTIVRLASYWPWLALGLGVLSLGLGHWLWQNTRLRDWVRERVRALAGRLDYSVALEKNTTGSNDQNQYHESRLWEKINV